MKERTQPLTRLLAVALLAIVLHTSRDATAATRYVSRDGGNLYPYTTPENAATSIQAAVDAAEAGDKVVVAPGVHREHVILKEGVNLSGSAGDEVTIYGVTPVKPVLTLTWDNVVEGLTIVGPPCSGVGIYAELGVPPAKTGSFKPFRISDCSIAWCAGHGILVFARQEPSEVLLRPDPRFASPEEWERYLEAIYDTELEVELSGCRIAECDGSGVVVHVEDILGKYEYQVDTPIQLGFKNATLRMSDCTVTDCTRNGVLLRVGWHDRAQLVMERCVVRDNSGHGVLVTSEGATWNGAVVRMNNCLVSGNQKAGVWSFSIDDGVWCDPFGGPCEGVEPFAVGSVFAVSSTVTGNSVGIVGSPFPPGLAAGTAPRISLKNCIVYGNREVDIDFRWFEYAVLMAGGIRHSCIGWKEIAGVRGNIDDDPTFADPENGDYRLLPGSPCIDAGGMYAEATIMLQDGVAVISWDPGKDLGGNPRIANTGPDMGAYETTGDAPDYVLESSADLVTWTEDYYGPATSWTDLHPDSSRTKFYRVKIGR